MTLGTLGGPEIVGLPMAFFPEFTMQPVPCILELKIENWPASLQWNKIENTPFEENSSHGDTYNV